MLLCIDIGNTNIVLGLYKKDKIYKKWRISTDEKKTEDEYAGIITNFISPEKVTGCIFSSVVPSLNSTFKKFVNKYFQIKPIIVGHKLKMNITLKYPNPAEIGADRIVNASAACHFYKSPVIIIDFGTATTFCFVNKKKEYLGGLILPGLPLMLRYLHLGTAKLPEVEITKPENIIGRNTIESIQSGLYHQTIGSIEYIIHILKEQYDNQAKVVLTGGIASLFRDGLNIDTLIEPDLTLKGLNLLYTLNK